MRILLYNTLNRIKRVCNFVDMQSFPTFFKYGTVLNILNVCLGLFFFVSMLSCKKDIDRSVSEEKTYKEFKVETLIEEISADTSDYTERIILVEGSIKDINYINNRNTIILKSTKNKRMSILCDMQKNQAAFLDSLSIGETISIKGILKGSLNDIILLNCIIAN